MEEDHFTNILMNILSIDDYSLLPLFLELLLDRNEEFDYRNLGIELFSKITPQSPKPYEYIIGIAPYKDKIEGNTIENNMDSIPDAWIYGNNFILLFEFKIRGTIDESQLAT